MPCNVDGGWTGGWAVVAKAVKLWKPEEGHAPSTKGAKDSFLRKVTIHLRPEGERALTGISHVKARE